MPAVCCLLYNLFCCRIKREAQNKHVDEVVQERAKVRHAIIYGCIIFE